jgi:hypothetical protein
MSLVEKELLTLPEHLRSHPVFSGVRVFFYMFCGSLFVHFLLAIVVSVLLRYTDSDYPVSSSFSTSDIIFVKILKCDENNVTHS